MFDEYALGVDVSHWQPCVDWALLARHGVSFSFIKAAQGSYGRDPSTLAHFKAAKAAGLLCGLYHWCDPNHQPSAQLENLKHAIGEIEFAMLAIDVEQYWQDWAEWRQKAVKQILPGKQISERALALAEMARDYCGKPVLIYTRASFVQYHAPQMTAWLKNWPLWLAHYPYARGRVSLNWQTLKSQYKPVVQAPALPEGCTGWDFWQFSGDKFVLPGCQTPLDLNFFQGSRRDLHDWLRTPMPAQVLPLEEKVRLLWQAHPDLWKEEEDGKKKSRAQAHTGGA